MRTISGSRSGGAQRAAAVVAVAGLASAFSMGTASAEVVPPWGSTPSITATAGVGAYSDQKQVWTPGSTGTPGVVSATAVTSPTSPTSPAFATGDLPSGILSATSEVTPDGPNNRRVARTAIQDGFYLAAPATVELYYEMDGLAKTTVANDGAGNAKLDALVAVDCVHTESGCIPNDANDDLPTVGHRQEAIATFGEHGTGEQEQLIATDTLRLELEAGWHTVEAATSSTSVTSHGATAEGTVSLEFRLTIVDVIGEPKVGWASASGLLPVFGGTEIGDDAPLPAPTPSQLLDELAASIADAQQDGAIRNSRPLLSKVEAAQSALAAGNEQAAVDALTALRNHLRAQSGKHVPADLATAWSTDAAQVFTQA